MGSEDIAFSVIVPLFNKAETVLRSIESVQAQDFSNWELVVVDDGSEDNGPELVAALNDSRIRLIRQTNIGVSAARNRGVNEARNEIIAFLDADDIWLPGYLNVAASLFTEFPQAKWVATSYFVQHARKGCYQARLRGAPRGFERGVIQDYFRVAILSDPPVFSSATIVKREIILSVGGFPASLSDGEDLLTWARLACKYPLVYDVRPLAIYDFADTPRPPDPERRVEQQLLRLLKENTDLAGLAAYIGLWDRMQAVKAMRFNYMALARCYAWSAVCYGPRQWRNIYTLILSCLPGAIRRGLDTFLRKLIH